MQIFIIVITNLSIFSCFSVYIPKVQKRLFPSFIILGWDEINTISKWKLYRLGHKRNSNDIIFCSILLFLCYKFIMTLNFSIMVHSIAEVRDPSVFVNSSQGTVELRPSGLS